MAVQAPAAQARNAPVASPSFKTPEVESIIAEASEQGQCAGLMAEVWRMVGERDIHRLRQLARTAPRVDDIDLLEQQLAAFVTGLEKVRMFVVAMKFAAEHDAQRGHHEADGLDWSTLLDGIEDMIPDEERLERSVSSTVSALRTLYWGASLQDQRAVPPVAATEAKQARRDVVSGATKASM